MSLATLFHQPRAVFLLAFVQLWNRFSHYGMRALLVLYMVKVQKTGDGTALGVYAVYCALVELGGLFGAFVAQRMLGLRRAVMVGGWLIGVGHLLLALEVNLLIALSFIILGSSLYTTNIATLLGNFYPPGDQRREQGFTLFYMSINIGALAATLLCGFAAETWGWHIGFGLAALGMVIANLILVFFRAQLQGHGEPPLPEKRVSAGWQLPLLILGLAGGMGALYAQHISTAALPWVAGALLLFVVAKLGMERRKTIALAVMGLVLFFAAEEQIGSSILLFADRMGEGSFSAMMLLAINPLVIIAGGPLAVVLLAKLKNSLFRSYAPFVLAGVAFAALAVGAYIFSETKSFPVIALGSVIAIISFAELLIGPSTYSQCSEVAQADQTPQVMALLPLGFAMAASCGGVISKGMAETEGFSALYYGNGFGFLALALIVGGAFFARAGRGINKGFMLE